MITGLEQLAALERRLEGVEERAATRAAPALLAVAKGQWSAGQGPSGESWPPTKDGRIALTRLTALATSHAEGSTIVIELDDICSYHQYATQPGHPARQLVPEDGEQPPTAWLAAVEDAITAEMEEG